MIVLIHLKCHPKEKLKEAGDRTIYETVEAEDDDGEEVEGILCEVGI